MNIPPQLLSSPNTQLFLFTIFGVFISLMWPINLVYVFLLTRAYSKDNTNLFKSFYSESICQTKNTIALIKLAIDKLSKKPEQSRKDNSKDKDLAKEDIDQDSVSEKTTNRDVNDNVDGLRKRNIDNNDLDGDVDTI